VLGAYWTRILDCVFQENPKYGGYAQQQNKEYKVGVECAINEHVGSKVHSKNILIKEQRK
jgi:hypothetical protein